MQQSDSQTGAMMNQKHTLSAAIHKTPETQSSSLVCMGRWSPSRSYLSYPSPSLFQAYSRRNFRPVNYWTTALLLTVVAVVGDLIAKHSPAARARGRATGAKRPDLDAKTCPPPLGLPTPKPRQARKNHNEKMSTCQGDNADEKPASGSKHCRSAPTYDHS